MSKPNIPAEILDHGLRAADTALLTAIFKHVCQNQPEIAGAIIDDALRLIPDAPAYEGEYTAEMVAKHALKQRRDNLIAELQPSSQIAGGFQRVVR